MVGIHVGLVHAHAPSSSSTVESEGVRVSMGERQDDAAAGGNAESVCSAA